MDGTSETLPRPYHVYVPRPSVVATNQPLPIMDDYGYHTELPHSSATEDSDENRNDILPCSKMTEFSSYGPSLPTSRPASVPSIPPSFSSMAVIEPPYYGSIEAHKDPEGAAREHERIHEREHRKRSKNWTRLETLKLIQVHTDTDDKFGQAGKKSELWDVISELLQRGGVTREPQQCKDKWEKLCTSYKEVRGGLRDKEDFLFYDEMHLSMSGKFKKREREGNVKIRGYQEGSQAEVMELNLSEEFGVRAEDSHHQICPEALGGFLCGHAVVEETMGTRREDGVVDIQALQELMDIYLAKQQKFFARLLDEVERREELKEKVRQEREDQWRAEEREQKRVLTNAMIILTQRLLGDGKCTGLLDHHRELSGDLF